ncbi:MAG: carbamoyltransferase HypF [Actinobacteria bacterium HGW-Actinobacteria-2]|nr:MAG: carbamoyltransferase HypF [Actinobacteria bacterium HGW-Actinobacteria-2]
MLTRREYLLRGVVQGVGFRPHVAVVAARHPVTGLVGNDDRQVFIEAQGEIGALEAFVADVLATLPPLARVIAVSSRDLDVEDGENAFAIVASRRLPGVRTLIPPDVATCDDCLADMADPANRRFGYAFTTCTNCGPRLTIIEDLPYDRPATTMKVFAMCPACAAEYTDPSDRRYHAQPISCFDCGPTLWIQDVAASGFDTDAARPAQPAAGRAVAKPSPRWLRSGEAASRNHDEIRAEHAAVIVEARRRLRAGQILAVKGLGGFHLMCDARNPDAVGRLRLRKRRSGKPFAVMVSDVAEALGLAELSPDQLGQLTNPTRPILIAPMASSYDLADAVAPGLGDVGVMLPYAPLHTLLLEPGLALVATSGNSSEEPLCYTNDDALARLAGFVDAFLLHDRDIHVPVEDSVMLALPGSDALPIRRSRGHAPLPVLLPTTTPFPEEATTPVVLGVGGELKNTFALAIDDLAFVSAHVGDMGSLASQQAFEASVNQLLTMQRREPDIVVCDLHPGYATTSWAERYADAHDVPLLRVQHHYAHALSLLAEYGIASGPVVVAALDGTGYGTDGTIWGGEILTLGADGTSPATWERTWHLPTFALVGGDRAIRYPWRIARGLAHSWGLDTSATPAMTEAPDAELRLVASQLASGNGVVQTSSAGRLFDAAAAMLGLCQEATYEAHAAMALERAAAQWARQQGIEIDRWGSPGDADAQAQLSRLWVPMSDPRSAFGKLLTETDASVGERAWDFHLGLASAFTAKLIDAARAAGTTTIGLTGGVVVNRIFTAALRGWLEGDGYTVLTHRVVPPTDGGLSLGQAWAGRLLHG